MSLNNCSFFSVKCVLIYTKVIKILHKTLFLKDFLAFTSLFFLEKKNKIVYHTSKSYISLLLRSKKSMF